MPVSEYLRIIFITLIPGLELRASLPYAILGADMPWFSAFIFVCIVNILLGPLVYFLLKIFLDLVIKIPFMKSLYERTLHKVQAKVQPKVEKYGEWGLALFIGIPLPGSGVYTGALAAFVLDIKPLKFFIATIVGVLIAAVIILIATLTGAEALQWIIKLV